MMRSPCCRMKLRPVTWESGRGGRYGRVEQEGAVFDAMHFVAFVQQKFGKTGDVLTDDADDWGNFLLLRNGIVFQVGVYMYSRKSS